MLEQSCLTRKFHQTKKKSFISSSLNFRNNLSKLPFALVVVTMKLQRGVQCLQKLWQRESAHSLHLQVDTQHGVQEWTANTKDGVRSRPVGMAAAGVESQQWVSGGKVKWTAQRKRQQKEWKRGKGKFRQSVRARIVRSGCPGKPGSSDLRRVLQGLGRKWKRSKTV